MSARAGPKPGTAEPNGGVGGPHPRRRASVAAPLLGGFLRPSGAEGSLMGIADESAACMRPLSG